MHHQMPGPNTQRWIANISAMSFQGCEFSQIWPARLECEVAENPKTMIRRLATFLDKTQLGTFALRCPAFLFEHLYES